MGDPGTSPVALQAAVRSFTSALRSLRMASVCELQFSDYFPFLSSKFFGGRSTTSYFLTFWTLRDEAEV